MLNAALWICQILLALVFGYSGVMKFRKTERELVTLGQTGVEGLPAQLIRLIGVMEILGTLGITLPRLTGVLPVLTPIAAVCFGIIMILASVVHFRRSEPKTAFMNLLILLVCAFVAGGRFLN